LDTGWRLTTSAGATYGNIDLKARLEEAECDTYFTLSHRLPLTDSYTSPAISFLSDHQNVRVYVDDALIYALDSEGSHQTAVSNNCIYLPSDYNGRMLRIEFLSDNPRHYDTVSPVYLGNYDQLKDFAVNRSLVPCLLFCAIATFTVFVFGNALRTLKNKALRLLPICLFFCLSALLAASYSPSFSAIASPQNTSFLRHLFLYLIPLTMYLDLPLNTPSSQRRLTLFPLLAQTLFLVFALLIHALSLLPLSRTMDIFLVLNLLCLLYYTVLNARLRRISFDIFWPTPLLLITLLCLAADAYSYWFYHLPEKLALIRCLLPILATLGLWRLRTHISRIRYENQVKEELNSYLTEAVLQNYENMEHQIQEMRKISHDLKNHYAVLYHLSGSGRHQEMLTYLQNLCNDYAVALPYSNTGNVVVDSVINDKLSRMQEMGARIRKTISLPGKLPLSNRDLCSILANLLDNALEALEPQQGGWLDFSIYPEDDLLFISCKNSKVGPTLEEDGQFYTTKPSKLVHGFGLGIIRSLTDKYDGTLHIQYDDEKFMVFISLPLQ
ncbi:MAG: sensor histidine kinase, partial [Christensenellaceae bacterium]|nr:sensor histidine kinase [Christensenellaceae bacterium]